MMLKDSWRSQRWFKATFLTAVVVSIALLAFFQWNTVEDQRYHQSDAVSSLHSAQASAQLHSSAASLDLPPSPKDFSAGNSTLGVSQKTCYALSHLLTTQLVQWNCCSVQRNAMASAGPNGSGQSK